jgi:type I restriction enzyme R subunit
MFGELPELFKDEDELRTLWSDPDTRKALLERLAERGYDGIVLMHIKDAINAQDSDIYDVLGHIAYARNMMTRAHRADAGKRKIGFTYDDKIAGFLDFVLGHYVETGVESLDRSQLPDYLKLKYGTLAEGGTALGGMQQVIDAYIGFQKQLYSPGN